MSIQIHPSSTSVRDAWDRTVGRKRTHPNGIVVTCVKREGYMSPITRDGQPFGELWQDARGYEVILLADPRRVALFGADEHGGWGLAYGAAERYAKGQ